MNLNEIKIRSDLASFLVIPLKKLTQILYVSKPDSYYKSFEIPKKNGNMRKISAPTGDLKVLQKILAKRLWLHLKEIRENKNIYPNISHAFEKQKSIITNAKIHRNKKYILNIDLENFFDSFHFGRVKGFFEKNTDFKVPPEIATMISQLCCYNGKLPQGAPTSPIITNLICQILDIHILKIAKKHKLNYTRYADDLTFSTNSTEFLDTKDHFIADIKAEIERSGFVINEKKTRLSYKTSQQKVTGLIVNKKINVDRKFCRDTYAMAHSLYKSGKFTINGLLGTVNQLEGRFAFINQLNRYNNKLDGKNHTFWCLCGKEKLFRKFLFYKYFFDLKTPLIVTEGKTDIIYLKAALKNLYSEYPDLLERTKDGSFHFKFAFLRRSERMRYFLNIAQDGADTMKNIYNFYSGQDISTPCLFLDLIKLRGAIPRNPVILLFDNELHTKKKPLYSFAEYVKLSDEKKCELNKNLSSRLFDKGNLYLFTTRTEIDKNESEMEDLIFEKTENFIIDDKIYSREDIGSVCSKDKFSKHILSNYLTINFSGFKPLLNKINDLVKDSK